MAVIRVPRRHLGVGRIMIVDDDPDIIESMVQLLESLGHDCVGITDPDEALMAAAEQKPDLIMHDLRMPGLSLSGMVASLRSHPDTAEIPLVFFSAHPDLPRTASKYDAWGYLPKPFTEPELKALLNSAIMHVPPGQEDDSDPERTVQDLFHDFWNTLSALAITTRTLVRSDTVKGDDRRAAEQLDDLLLKLESKTDRLRASIGVVINDVKAEREARAHQGADFTRPPRPPVR